MSHLLTVIIPTYNEADNIVPCLQSVAFADEIIVLDSYSTDATVSLAAPLCHRIITRKYDTPAAQKNWAIPQAAHSWVLLLDADERVTPELAAEIRAMIALEEAVAGYWIYRQNHFMGKKVRYSGWQSDKVIRLIRRDECRYPDVLVHEEIVTEGKVGFLKHKLLHYTYKDLDSYLQKMNRYAEWQATEYAHKTPNIGIFQLILKPCFRFFKHYILRLGFLDGTVGILVSGIMAYGVFMRYARLWVKRNELTANK